MPLSRAGLNCAVRTLCTGLVPVAAAFLLLAVSPVRAQAPAECAVSDCALDARQVPPADRQLWLDAAATHDLKRQFVEILQRFLRAQAGTFGDEGADLVSSVAGLKTALSQWDAAVTALQTRAARMAPSADVHLVVATVLLDRGRVGDALRALDTAARLDEGRAEVHRLRALAYGLTDRPADAAQALRRATSLDPDDPTLFYARAQYAAQLSRPEEVAQAQRGFHQALRARRLARGPDAAGVSPFERVDLLRQVPGTAPVFAQARFGDALAALSGGDYALAISRLAAAVALDPLVAGDADARLRRAQGASRLRDGQVSAAQQLLQGVVTDAPDDSEAHRVLALAYWVDDQPGRSIEQLRAAIRLAPADERARVMLADVLLEDGRAAEAERELTLAIDAGMRSGQVHYRLGQIHQRQALLPEAARQFDLARQYGPVVGRDHFLRTIGGLLVNRADFDGAVAAYARRVGVNPNNAEAHRQLGEIYFLQGRHDEALMEFTTAVWLDPADWRAHAAAGHVHVRALKYAEAATAFERALALNEGANEARYALATALTRLGKTEDARREMATFERVQAQGMAVGQREFRLDALRREASRSLLAGALDRAVDLYMQAMEVDPDSARSHRELGTALLRARQPIAAIEHLHAARRVEETAEVVGLLTEAYAAAGNREESAQSRARYAELVQQARLERIRTLGS